MKATGIVRKIDRLGRIVVPKEIRDTFGWDIGTPMEMYTDGKSVVLKAYPMQTCVRCGGEVKEDHSYCPKCGKEKRPT